MPTAIADQTVETARQPFHEAERQVLYDQHRDREPLRHPLQDGV